MSVEEKPVSVPKTPKSKFSKTITKSKFPKHSPEEESSDTKRGLKTLQDVFGKGMRIGQASYSHEQRQVLIDSLVKSISGISDQVIQKRIGSKAVQACLKYADTSRIASIGKLLITSNLPKYLTGTYTHYLIRKYIKVCTKKDRETIFESVKRNLGVVVSTMEGNRILDCLVNNFCSNAQISELKAIIDERVKNSPESIADFGLKLVDRTLPKNCISAHLMVSALKVVIPVEKAQIVTKLAAEVWTVSSSNEGVRLAVAVMHLSDSKERKVILKVLQDNLNSLFNENRKYYMLLIKALRTFDDTKALNKFLIKPLISFESQLFETTAGQNILKDTLGAEPISKILKDYDSIGVVGTSKKEDGVRKEEIVGYLVPQIIKLYEPQIIAGCIRDPIQAGILGDVIDRCLELSKGPEFIENILQIIIGSCQSIDDSLIVNAISHKIVKKLLKSLLANPQFPKLSTSGILHFIKNNLISLLKTKGIFVIISCMEGSEEVKKEFSAILKSAKLPGDEVQGMKVLRSLIH